MTPERLKLEIIAIFQQLHESGPLTMPCAAVAAAKLDEVVRPLCAQAAGARDLAAAAERYVEAVNRWDEVTDGEKMPSEETTQEKQDGASAALTDALRTLVRAIYLVNEKPLQRRQPEGVTNG